MVTARETGVRPVRTTRPSAVSQALRAIRDHVECDAPKWRFKDARGTGFRIFIARRREALDRAQRLVHRMYVQRGYASEQRSEADQSPLTPGQNSITFLAEDEYGREAGTVTLAFDGPDGLPSEEIYGEELNELRARGRRLVEVTKLAIHDRYSKSKTLLVQLFNFISIYSRRVRQDTDFVVSVNPRHALFYKRLLVFEVAGPERPCPRVQNAPAVLLRLDLSIGRPESREQTDLSRTLYPHFSSLCEENVIAGFLKKAISAMASDSETVVLPLSRSAIHPVV